MSGPGFSWMEQIEFLSKKRAFNDLEVESFLDSTCTEMDEFRAQFRAFAAEKGQAIIAWAHPGAPVSPLAVSDTR